MIMTPILNWSTKAGQSATNYIKKGYISIAIMVSLFQVGLFLMAWQGAFKIMDQRALFARNGRQDFTGKSPEIAVLLAITSWRSEGEVDKNREKCVIFVYLSLQKRGARP